MKEVNLRKSNTRGLETFINTIRIAKPTWCENTIFELSDFIVSSGCKAIEFRKMSNRAMGISKTDACILNLDVLTLLDEYTLYIILHEVAHQHQYTKHGKNLVLDVYLESTPLEEAARKLLLMEQVADRLAIRKLRKLSFFNAIVPRYLEITDLTQIKNHICNIRESVKDLQLESIEEINNCIYDLIK